MSFTGLGDDRCTIETEMLQNTSWFGAHMDPNRFMHDKPCRHAFGITGANTGVSTVSPQPTPCSDFGQFRGDLVALENDLRGQTRPSTRCPAFNYIPKNGKIASQELYKPVEHPVINTNAFADADTCQMVSYAPLPELPIKPGPANCGKMS